MPNARGADVSHWHPIRDAGALCRAVPFVGIKVSEGGGNTDPTVAANLAAVRAQPFELVVLYHLARPGAADGQAERFLGLVGDLRPNERLALDTERTSMVDTDYLSLFFDTLPLDRRHLLYTSAGVWKGMGDPEWTRCNEVDLWLPRYGNQEPQVPGPWWQAAKSWTIWQDSQQGVVPGIDGPCDTNQFHGGLDDLRAWMASPPF